MRFLISLIVMILMTLGPVASLSAQVFHAQSHHQSTTQTAQTTSNKVAAEEAEDSTTTVQHSCCQDECNCSFQNECDIQPLTFFAIPFKTSLPSATVSNTNYIAYAANTIFLSLDSIYRPPILSI